jgi:lipoate-protein ligase A
MAPGPAAWNMAVDQALLQAMDEAPTAPVVRFYSWRPWAVSFGYGQDPGREVDLQRCAEQGIEVVRRVTGGRAVLHAEELTYSVVCAAADPVLGERIDETYRRIGEALVAGLQRFGVPAALERAGTRPPRAPAGQVASPCFASIARSEVKVNGRKLVGSAQRRLGNAVLQHGSVLTGPAHRQLLDLLPPLPPRVLAAWQGQLRDGCIDLSECVQGPVDHVRLRAEMVAGFRAALGADLVPAELTAHELALATAFTAAASAGLGNRSGEGARAPRSQPAVGALRSLGEGHP